MILDPRPTGSPRRSGHASRHRCRSTKTANPEAPTYPRVTAHQLRHTAASLMIASGAHVMTIQRLLGHKSAAMTLDNYWHLFDDDLDGAADR
ncbi:tyrosine-type recombinase/integrase [Nocardia asteroides]|uniref:tyrosine-type recombinase/integrase n=1 Tax=Nocardia asteroides TaxID=1824 RepID=UPI0036585552